ncbi:MAG: hypothetical protein E7055_11115 [Lentisphaerae bacterium]|nr:hypothetical protein [Lentisphaerota bacterium]
MNEVKIADAVLKTAEKVASIDLKKVGRKARELNADSIGTVTRKFVNAINPHCPERTEKRIQATLDIAYLLGNLGGWYSEKQEKRFEEIAANLGRKPSDVSPDAVGLNAKLAHLRSRVSEDELLAEFINGVRSGCESFGGLLVPSRRAFALWIALGLADGEMPELYRKALMLLRGEFKHSALLYGALGGLPVYAAASAVGGLGMGIVTSIMGGLQGLKHKQTLDRYCPLVSDEFLSQAETQIRKMGELENQLARTDNPAEKEHIQQEYAAVSQHLQELIEPPSPDDDEEEDEE